MRQAYSHGILAVTMLLTLAACTGVQGTSAFTADDKGKALSAPYVQFVRSGKGPGSITERVILTSDVSLSQAMHTTYGKADVRIAPPGEINQLIEQLRGEKVFAKSDAADPAKDETRLEISAFDGTTRLAAVAFVRKFSDTHKSLLAARERILAAGR